MAGIIGRDMSEVVYGTTPTEISNDINSYLPVEFAPETWLFDDDFGRLSGLFSSPRISARNGWGIVGQKQKSFLDDYYFRIHVSPSSIDAGNLVSQQEVEVSVWNAFLNDETLQQILASGGEGISVVQPGATPFVFEPLAEHIYTFQIGTDGPASIDASYLFDFVSGDYPLSIVGSRVTPWLWRPDWASRMIERLEWVTDSMRAYDGTEQRVKLREFPRRTLEFGFSAQGKMRRRLDSALYDWGARQWAVPFWPDGEILSAPISIGALSIPANTATRDYHAGGLLMLLSETSDAFEVAEIASVSASLITLARQITQAWPAGTTSIFPARVASLPDSHGFSRFTHDFVYGIAQMQFEDSSDWPEAAPAATHYGNPVLTEKPNWIDDVNQDFQRIIQELDYAIGTRLRYDQSGAPEIVQNHRWLLDGRDSISEFRSWLYSRSGKFSGIWVPTWVDDLIVTQPIGEAVAAITVENVDYSRRIAAGIHRNDIMLRLKNGQVFYRRVISAAEIDATEETLTIDSPFGIAIAADDVEVVSYMAFMRLDGDGVELAWFDGETADCSLNMRAIKHDL